MLAVPLLKTAVSNASKVTFSLVNGDVDTLELYNKLVELDPLTKVDKFNRRRVIRAYIQATNNSFLSKRVSKDEPLYDILIICLTCDREIMYDRINKRVDKMISMGLVDEVKSLRNEGYYAKQIGYKEINSYLDGDISLDEAIELIKLNTRHYAKRQITWFKNQMNAVMVDIFSDPLDKVVNLMNEFYNK